MMHYNACMRTTIELSDPVYRRLKATAVDRGLRGFSPIVEEALSEYFQSERERSQVTQAIRAARGAWGEAQAAEFERERKEAWATWQLPQS
jgi:metal-responsive CopG/Arc/MetJ family transcriptional regulator